MNEHTKTVLEFDKILSRLCELAVSPRAAEKLSQIEPLLKEDECRARQQDTTQARRIMETFGTPPLAAMSELDKILELCQKGAMLIPEQLTSVAQFISASRRMKLYLKKAEELIGGISAYGNSMEDLSDLAEEIERSIRIDKVDDNASPALRDIRRKIENTSSQIKAKLESILRSKKEWFTDSYVSMRSGHFVLPVKREYRHQVQGSVVGSSGTGGTYFIEPAAAAKHRELLASLHVEEDNEVRRILYTLTALVDEFAPSLKRNAEAMEILDIAFAKAKLSMEMDACPADISSDRAIIIHNGRHPLLKQDTCVPLEFSLGISENGASNGIVITGPNTGGKTVALKTVGLLSLMAQSGLHVPAAPDSKFSMRNLILCDIGDGQSISENLSTFSAHITNIIEILRQAGPESLILLDELGSGTDPAEGMGIAVSVLEELNRRGCLFIATTHYPEVKEYARKASGLVNARMAFDRESLRPLYRLEIGEAGESCALYIAQRLGFPSHMLEFARDAAYGNDVPLSAGPAGLPAPGAAPSVQRSSAPTQEAEKPGKKFSIGDSVIVYPQRETGIVWQPANEFGEVGVQVKGKKQFLSHKRLKLRVPASELYPPDYDFSILFDTVANRKARHQMDKGHRPGVAVLYEQVEPPARN